MATLLGIDLGHHSVKLALMEGRLGRVELSEFRQRRVVPSDGQKASVEDRLEALRILMAEGIDASSQVMGFPTEKASVRSLEMPFLDPGQIDKTLSFELEGHVPFDLDDFVLDYRIARGGRALRLGADGKSLVLCGLAAEEAVVKQREFGVAFKSGMAAVTPFNTPTRLTLMVAIIFSKGTSSRKPNSAIPALLKMMSSRPFTTLLNRAMTSSNCVLLLTSS